MIAVSPDTRKEQMAREAPGGQRGSQEAFVEGPMSSDEDHLKMAFSSFARRTEALAICFLRIGSARTR